jgi:hypothetical protein
MEKEFVPYDRSLKLKQLGFDKPCLAWHNSERLFLENHDVMNNEMSRNYCCVLPTFSQCFRWFREKYGLFVSPNVISYEDGPYLWFFEINSTVLPFGTDLGETDDYKTYEEAELACLDKLIELVESELK